MAYVSRFRRIAQWLVLSWLLGFGLVMAQQAEPTLNQVYETAQAGNLDKAQLMMQQVLISHPNSAKAHFVQAELYARQGNVGRAREALATAEKLAPGLPFAKPAAVQALRAQLASTRVAPSYPVATSQGLATPAAPTAPFPWGLALLLGGGLIAFLIYWVGKRNPSPTRAAYSSPGSLTGPQTFGMGNAGTMQPVYGQPTGSGIGGKVMGGLATGLAVGAGVMAAEAIGRNLMGNHDGAVRGQDYGSNLADAQAANPDMGGQDFGINDTSSWDDGANFDNGGGGGDWDN